MANLTDLEFDKFFLEASDMIYSLGLRLFKQEEDANDFVQDLYLHAFKKKNKFQGRSKFSTWLYSVGLNLGLNRLKKNKKLKTETMDGDNLPEIESFSIGTLDAIINNETQYEVQKAVERLPELYRLSLVLYYYENLSYTKIAEVLNQKEGTVKSNLHRAKRILRDQLKSQFGRKT